MSKNIRELAEKWHRERWPHSWEPTSSNGSPLGLDVNSCVDDLVAFVQHYMAQNDLVGSPLMPMPEDRVEPMYNLVKHYVDVPGPYYINRLCKNAWYITNRHTEEFVETFFFEDHSEKGIRRMEEYAKMRLGYYNLAYQHGVHSLLRQHHQPTAWYVIRHVPGKADDGVRYGPFFKESEADEWVDENHLKFPLYEWSPQDEIRPEKTIK